MEYNTTPGTAISRMIDRRRLAGLACCALLLSACDGGGEVSGPLYGGDPAEEAATVYRLAVHPLHNPAKLAQAYQPLVDRLNAVIPEARFELEASRDYADYESKLRARGPALLLPNPWQTLEAMKVGYRVIAMAGEADDFKGLFIVRRDGDIRVPADLKGRAISYPSPTALAACIMPQWFLHEHGIDVTRDIDNRYVGSQESSIMNVHLGHTAAGATWPPPWRAFQKSHPQEAAKLRVIWETPPLVNNAVMARDDVAPELAARIAASLFDLRDDAQGRAILAGMETARFQPANDADYAPARDFIQRFEAQVRPVEQR